MDEASKLLSLCARAKSVLFTTRSLDERVEMIDDLRQLRRRGGDAGPWLLVDLPWRPWTDEHKPARKILVDERRLT
jgi:hypothetical protein